MTVQFARIEQKECPMFDPNCLQRVAELIATYRVQPFTPEDAKALIEKTCGRYVRGKHKGEIRGYAHIRVCTVGGWQVLGPGQGNGRVVYPGRVLSVTIVDFVGNAYLKEGENY